MELTTAEIEGYRSLRSVRLMPGRLTVLVGANGVGKTNLLHGIELIQSAALGTICRRIAEEGGLETTLWAGRGKGPETTRMRFTIEVGVLKYRIEIGPPGRGEAALSSEPTVREEALVRTGIGPDGSGEQAMLQREGASVLMRDARGQRQRFKDHLMGSETALAAFRDSAAYPEVAFMRQVLESWRVYHRFSLGVNAPARRPALALCTPALAPNGNDLAAALATIVELKQGQGLLDEVISQAFPGARLMVTVENGLARFALALPDIVRPVPAAQISEGALQLISLVAALHAFRPPAFIAMNEPEAGIHPSLIDLVARLVVQASTVSQVCIVTQSAALTAAVARLASNAQIVDVSREDAQTILSPRRMILSDRQPAPGPKAATAVADPLPERASPSLVGSPPRVAATAPDSETAAADLPRSPVEQAGEPSNGAACEPLPAVKPSVEVDELRQLEEARAALADIQAMVAQIEADPNRFNAMAGEIRQRLAVLRAAERLLPSEVATLTAHLEKELEAHAAALLRRKSASG